MDNHQVGKACTDDELLSAIVIDEVEADRMGKSTKEFWGTPSGTPSGTPEDSPFAKRRARLVRSIYHRMSTFDDDDNGEYICK